MKTLNSNSLSAKFIFIIGNSTEAIIDIGQLRIRSCENAVLNSQGAFHCAKNSGRNSNGKVRFGFFWPEYTGSPLEVVNVFRSEYSDRNARFHLIKMKTATFISWPDLIRECRSIFLGDSQWSLTGQYGIMESTLSFHFDHPLPSPLTFYFGVCTGANISQSLPFLEQGVLCDSCGGCHKYIYACFLHLTSACKW